MRLFRCNNDISLSLSSGFLKHICLSPLITNRHLRLIVLKLIIIYLFQKLETHTFKIRYASRLRFLVYEHSLPF